MTPFEVVLVPFPFADLTTKKQRPALVLNQVEATSLGSFGIIAMITSNLAGLSFPHDQKITDLKSAGLPKPSLVRLDKVVTIEASLIKKTLGKLSLKDIDRVKSGFRSQFGAFF